MDQENKERQELIMAKEIKKGGRYSLSKGDLTQLRLDEESIRSVCGIERIMGALFDEFTFGDYEDLIGVADGGEAVGDDE